MAVDMFLRVDKIKGESKDSKHGEEILVNGWNWVVTQVGTSGVGGGSGAGKVAHQDLEIRKFVDRSSPVLYGNCCSGAHIPSADLTVRKAGGDALEYLTIHLEDLLITSFTLGGEPKNDQVEEIIRINYSKIKITYTPQVKGGGGDAPVIAGWDLETNQPVG